MLPRPMRKSYKGDTMEETKAPEEMVHEAPQILDEGGVNPNNQALGVDDPIIGNNDDALITDNQEFSEESQPEPQVQGEHTQENQDGTPTNWEASAKYFQSEKDKMFEENKKLSQDLNKYKALGEFVDGRPDVQEYLQGMLQGGQPTNNKENVQPNEPAPKMDAPPEDFDPWDAYNEPQSISYQYRVNQEQNNVQSALKKFKTEIVGQYEQEKKLNAFDKELSNLGLDDVQKKQFYEFANTPVAQMGTEQLVQMWRATTPSSAATQPDPSIAATKRTQNTPQTGGVLQGAPPQVEQKSDTDSMWDGIVSAADKNKIF